MEIKDTTKYKKDVRFSQEKLFMITPTNVYNFMCLKVYGKTNPYQNDFPTEGRSSSLTYYKKPYHTTYLLMVHGMNNSNLETHKDLAALKNRATLP